MSRPQGNLAGLKTTQKKRLERLSSRRVSPGLVISPELARELAAISHETGRQIGLLLDRAGRVASVLVGDRKGILIPVLPQVRGTGGRLKGLRCVHTHLAGEGLSRDDLMDLACLRLDLMAALCIDERGYPTLIHRAHLIPAVPGRDPWTLLEPVHPAHLEEDFLLTVSALEDEFVRRGGARHQAGKSDRAILVSVGRGNRLEAEASLDELAELARTAGVEVVARVVQRQKRINPRFIMGRGKLGDIMLMALQTDANLLIFDQELNPSQARSITDHTDMRVIDRTQLILDIFALRARSREGKLQVEMAQLKYLMPRLASRDDALSRLTGGIGARGPGETKLEIDRRRIKDRLAMLASRLKTVSRQRDQRRRRRKKNTLPIISLVGYTNAGKSTLLNSLTGSSVMAEDQLFATLDPTTRRLRFPRDFEVVISDTVGFISRLPDDLLQAFMATLEELAEADLLLHVIDGSSPAMAGQVAAVERIIRELDLARIPMLRVLNKIDLIEEKDKAIMVRDLDAVPLCAKDLATFGSLIGRIEGLIGH